MVYLNSLFSLRFTLLPLSILSSLKEKIVLAPRGMLGKGSLRIKPFKKKLFLKSFKLLGWHKKVNWHVTTEIEKKSVLNFFGSYASVYLAANLSKTHPYKVTVKIKELNKLNVFFLSRISSIKNLIIAIKTLQYIEPKFKLNLTIIGPVEDEAYWQKCQKELQKLPKNVNYSIMGAVLNNEIPGILKNQHILFLPTRHENFGHVIVESWQNGCPTIISDQTPWTQLEEKKVGVDIPLAQEHLFKEKVEMFASMDQEEFNTWSTSAKKYVYQITNDEMLIKQYKKILSPQA
jgi:glycosyltransferase involved in cell wall biosynthesis